MGVCACMVGVRDGVGHDTELLHKLEDALGLLRHGRRGVGIRRDERREGDGVGLDAGLIHGKENALAVLRAAGVGVGVGEDHRRVRHGVRHDSLEVHALEDRLRLLRPRRHRHGVRRNDRVVPAAVRTGCSACAQRAYSRRALAGARPCTQCGKAALTSGQGCGGHAGRRQGSGAGARDGVCRDALGLHLEQDPLGLLRDRRRDARVRLEQRCVPTKRRR